MKYISKISFVGFALAVAPVAANAQRVISLEDAVGECSSIGNSGQRLQCFDDLARLVAKPDPSNQAAVENSNDASAATPPIAPSAPAVAAAPQDAAPAPSTAIAAVEPSNRKFIILDAEDPKNKHIGKKSAKDYDGPYMAKVVAFKKNNAGLLFVELDNGEIWREIKPASNVKSPKRGSEVRVKRGPIAGYDLTFSTTGEKVRMKKFSLSD